MSEIKNWFEEHKHQKVHNCGDYEFIIRKGFKITHYFEEDEYTIQDTRHCDFYKSVTESDMEIIQTNGFVRGTSIIMHNRNVDRVELYLEKIRKLYDKKAEYKAKLSTNKAFYEKRIRNCNNNIHEYNATMQYYRFQVEQFEKQKLN